MKLSFSLSSKPSSKQPSLKPAQKLNDDRDPATESATNREYVTEFDASKTLTDAQQSKKLVIPPKPNEWRPHKKMKNLDLPLQPSDHPDLRFEVESASVADGGPDISYGLNLRNSSEGGNTDAKNFESDGPPPRPASVETVMLQKLKEDLKRLPDDRGLDEYADMPVEGFGAALLAGYGWYEGRGIGRNAKEDVKVVQYERRTAKEGLGFIGDIPSKNNGISSNAVKRKENEQRTSSGGEEQGQFSVGKDVRIIGGRDVGLKGRIVEVVGGGDFVILKLLRSEEVVKVSIGNVAELGSVEEDRCLRKLKELKIQRSKDEVGGFGRQRVKDSSSDLSRREGKQEKRKDNKWSGEERRSEKREEGKQEKRKYNKCSGEERSEKREELKTNSQVNWLTSHIRVRIISKNLKGGRLYLKKGEIVDVVGPTTCDVSMDDSRELIQGVDQDVLETALPRRGGPVIILYGKHKGVYGSLVERDMENETGVVRDADTHALLNVSLQQIAEYIGDPSYIGY